MAAMEPHGCARRNDVDGGVKVKFIETQFVSSDAASFKSVVQRLTGKSATIPSPGQAAAEPVPLHRPRARAPCSMAGGGWAEQASHSVVPSSNNLVMTTAAPIKREAHHTMPNAPSPRLDALHEICDFADLLYATAGARRDGGTNGFPY